MDILNLQKNDILDLTKKDSTLNHLMIATGWDVVEPQKGFFSSLFQSTINFDLDLFALKATEDSKVKASEIVYFGQKTHRGIQLMGDNLTGEGDGDDEIINVTLSDLPSAYKRVVLGLNIYNAKARKQTFKNIKNAYIRLVDRGTGKEICRYNLTETGGDHNAIIMAELIEENGFWSFKAVGEYYKANNIQDVLTNYVERR